MDEVKIWAIGANSEAVALESKGEMDSEALLEDTLVKNPGLLMQDLKLVGRQTPTEGGPLDLLGVDRNGRLVVFELKPGALYRDAVAQIIDYASALDDMELGALAEHISERSGAGDIEKIEDFEQWYAGLFPNLSLDSLKPLRMFLVGLGADAATERMVTFLAKSSGMDISLLTFHGFVYDGKTLLAKQVQVEASGPGHEDTRDQKARLRDQFRELGAEGLLDDARQMFRNTWHSERYEYATKSRWNFQIAETAASGNPGYRVYFAIAPDVERRGIKVCFLPRATGLSKDKFDQLSPEAISFEAPAHGEILFPVNPAEWETHREQLTELTRSVYEAWLRGERLERINLDRQLADSGVHELFQAVEAMFRENWNESHQDAEMWWSASRSSWAYGLGVRFRTGLPLSARIDPEEGSVRLVFLPGTKELCLDEFRRPVEEIRCETWPKNREPMEDAAAEIQFILTGEEWETHKETLTALTKAVYAAWESSGQDDGVDSAQPVDAGA